MDLSKASWQSEVCNDVSGRRGRPIARGYCTECRRYATLNALAMVSEFTSDQDPMIR
jgi:hypothetical protein